MAATNTRLSVGQAQANAGHPQGELLSPLLPSRSKGTGRCARTLIPEEAQCVLRSAGQGAGVYVSRAGNPIGQGTRPEYPEQQAHAGSTVGYTVGWSHQDVCSTPPAFLCQR